ncbi:MAG: hypothetical protein V3S51_02320 [Dehalococcoidia bacterium]
MKRKKWLVLLVGLALVVAASAGTAVALTGDGPETLEQGTTGQVDEPTGQQPPIRSDEGIDPDECNHIHNITACEDGSDWGIAIEPYPMPVPGDPKGPIMDIPCGPNGSVAVSSDGQVWCLEPADPQSADDGTDLVSPSVLPLDVGGG